MIRLTCDVCYRNPICAQPDFSLRRKAVGIGEIKASRFLKLLHGLPAEAEMAEVNGLHQTQFQQGDFGHAILRPGRIPDKVDVDGLAYCGSTSKYLRRIIRSASCLRTFSS